MKVLPVVLIALVVFVSCNMQTKKNHLGNLTFEKFYWSGDTFSGKYIQRSGMYVPLQIDTLMGDYYAQFDLGASGTVLYHNNIKSLLKTHPSLSSRIDSMGGAKSDDGKPLFKIDSLQLSSGKINLGKRLVYGFFNYGEEIVKNAKKPQERSIGTVGVDVVQNKMLIIDFPGEQYTIIDNLNDNDRKLFKFTKCDIVNNKIIVPFVINGVTYHFMYDSGSSFFYLMTTQKIWELLTDKRVADTLDVSNFGNHIKMSGAKSKVALEIDNRKHTDFLIYYDNNGFFNNFYISGKMDGIIGNALFFDDVICVDFKNKEFGILQ